MKKPYAISEKHKDILNQYNQSSKELPDIPVVSNVLIHEPKNKSIHRWINSGIVLDILPNRQYKKQMQSFSKDYPK